MNRPDAPSVRPVDKTVAGAVLAAQTAAALGALAWATARGLVHDRQVLRAMRGRAPRPSRVQRRRARQRRWAAAAPSALRDDVVTSAALATTPLDAGVDRFLDELEADRG